LHHRMHVGDADIVPRCVGDPAVELGKGQRNGDGADPDPYDIDPLRPGSARRLLQFHARSRCLAMAVGRQLDYHEPMRAMRAFPVVAATVVAALGLAAMPAWPQSRPLGPLDGQPSNDAGLPPDTDQYVGHVTRLVDPFSPLRNPKKNLVVHGAPKDFVSPKI